MSSHAATLAERQSAFIARILDEDMPMPDGWTARHAAGMAIYRNNYRTTMVEALQSTFERTARWIGVDAFQQAAAHHIITNPASSWTLDDAGEGFDETLAILFANDPEVAELAWVEWSMHRAFGADNAVPLDAAGFARATSRFAEQDWEAMRLVFLPRFATRIVRHKIACIWNACAADMPEVPDYALDTPVACHVYREGERPVFVTAPAHEVAALDTMLAGASFGDLCVSLCEHYDAEAAAAEAGAMLGRWLHQGIITAIR